MLKILFIRSNPVSPEPKVEKEAQTLGDNGYHVEILAWDRSGENLEFDDKNSYVINRFKLNASYGRPELVFKLILWFFYELIFLIKSDCDIIHAFDLDTLIPAVIIAKIRNKPLVYDCADFYADSLPESIPLIIRNFVAMIEIFFSRFADVVILVDESRKKQFKNKLKRVIIINNTPMETFRLNKIHKENKKFVIFYAGIFHENRGLDKLIEATKNIDGLKIMIAGYDIGHRKFSQEFINAQNMTFLGKIPYEKVIERTMQSDMIFALYDPKIPNHKYASPNKLFEAMMCGKPVLTNYGTIMSEIVMKENCGVLAAYENVEDIRNAIIQLKNNSNLRKTLGENGLKAYKTKYNWNTMEKRLLNVYKALTGE